jgi:hypothetical protein
MGVDTSGRLWLGWLDGASSKPGVALKLVQLDPSTLQPLASKKLDHTLLYDSVGGGLSSFVFTCGDVCRFVYQGLLGAYSWDGSATPTRLWANDFRKDVGGHLVAASGRPDGLALANYADKVRNVPDDGQQITVERAGVHGGALRKFGSIAVPQSLPHGPSHIYAPQSLPAAIFTPAGLVVLALYVADDDTGGKLLSAVVRG